MGIRFYRGFPRTSEASADGVEGWATVRGSDWELTAERFVMLFAGGLSLAAIMAATWFQLSGRWMMYMRESELEGLAIVLLTLAIHELVHLLALPKTVSERGFGLCLFGAFVAVRGRMTKERGLVVLLAPLIVLSGGPLLWHLVFGLVDVRIVYASIWNAALSIVDIVSSYYVLTRVPRAAVIHVGSGPIRFALRA